MRNEGLKAQGVAYDVRMTIYRRNEGRKPLKEV